MRPEVRPRSKPEEEWWPCYSSKRTTGGGHCWETSSIFRRTGKWCVCVFICMCVCGGNEGAWGHLLFRQNLKGIPMMTALWQENRLVAAGYKYIYTPKMHARPGPHLNTNPHTCTHTLQWTHLLALPRRRTQAVPSLYKNLCRKHTQTHRASHRESHNVNYCFVK